MNEAIAAMNAEIQERLAALDLSYPMTKEERLAWEENRRQSWGKIDADNIRRKHGFVPCGDAPGWRFAG